MKRVIKISNDSALDNDDFDKQWNRTFGEPENKIFENIEDFDTWMKEVEQFEVNSHQTV